MDQKLLPLFLEAIQYATRGVRYSVFSLPQIRAYVLLRAPKLSFGEVTQTISEGEGIFWRTVGPFLMATPLGSNLVWERFGKPSTRNPNAHRHNATARYLAQRWSTLVPYIRSYLTRKLKRSAELDKIEDHIQAWFTLALERDYLAKYLVNNNEIPPSLIGMFVYRKAASDLRKDGRDPCCRALHGALAPHEVQARKEDVVPWSERVETSEPVLGEDPLVNMADRTDPLAHMAGRSSTEEPDVEEMSGFIARLLAGRFQGVSLWAVYEAQYDLNLGVDQTARQLGSNRTTIRAARQEILRLIRNQKTELRQTFGLSV